MASTSTGPGLKRKLNDIIVDPDTLKKIEDSKKPKIDLNADKKFACLSSIVTMYNKILVFLLPKKSADKSEKMDTDQLDEASVAGIKNNISCGNHIMSIIFTIHNVNRQAVKGKEFNIIKKTSATSYKIHYKGKDYNIPNDTINSLWRETLKAHGLEYKDFDQKDEAAWYGTMGPYLDMFSAYPLRVNELRLGHNNVHIIKVDGVHKSFPGSKYELSGAHHVLLEGTSFPPERRSSIVQSVDPMTAWLCMLRSDHK